jgi:Na+/glutamate symporter
MIIGLSVGAFTTLHIIISLLGIGSGLLVLTAMLAGREPRNLTALFLCSTILTSATGFLFHSAKIGPPHVVGAISLAVLALALVGLYLKHLRGVWRPVYVVSAVLSLYLNAFVGVVQAFAKLSILKSLAPTG